ncbi:hypothetical protein DFH08DRAFT_1000436 [Mycena albidolilacea]|uniref:Uncharacterized protein n=1 Tax=Mycena albidolilacea TaxID=1033008 RepID=A0AAD7ERV3_9AGAR|nr:hypothetical protein DFH08DRAFT_1000436 [Mycena albidolilacea]
MPPQTTVPMLPSSSPSETESQAQTDDSTHLLLRHRPPAVAAHARLLPDSTAPGITLSCGAEHEIDPATDDWWDARRPAVVPYLPWPSEQPQDRTSPQRPPCRSTGCGARVHPRAHAARDGGHWVGYVDGMERTVVIRLDGQYFRERSALVLGGAGCGCVVDGVGCAVCGNALGALHIPCRVHRTRKGPAHYVFLPSAVSPSIKDAAESSHPTASTSPISAVNVFSTEFVRGVANAASMTSAAMPLPPVPPSTTENLFSTEFIQSVANGLDEFVDVGLFRGDGDLNFERDFGQWFNPDDVGMELGGGLNENTYPRPDTNSR